MLFSCDPSPKCTSNAIAADTTGRDYDWYRIAFAFIATLQACASLRKGESLTRFQLSHRRRPRYSSKSTEIKLRSSPMVLSHIAAMIKGKGVNGSDDSSAPDVHPWRPSLSNNSDEQSSADQVYHKSVAVCALEAFGETSVYKARCWSGK